MPTVALAFRNEAKTPPYDRALRAAGLDVISFRPGGDSLPWDVGGLVLSGGSDVDPALYGESKSPECGSVDRERDDYEIGLLRIALQRDVPVLAICRGMQLLNVAQGGTLIQHLPNSDKHRHQPHRVTITEPLQSLFGIGEMLVNSRHHQAVAKPGAGLAVTARDPEDDVVEGIALQGAAWVYGVQWHPEDMADDELQGRLFARFAAAVQQHLAR